VGAKVVGERVYLDRGLVRDLIATIPADFTYSRGTPPTTCAFGGDAFDLRADDRRALSARSRRRAPQPHARRSGDVPQAQPHAPALHSSAHHIVEPMDHPISHRHLRITYSSMKHSDKTFMGMTTSPKNAEDVMEMCAILFGEDFMERTRSHRQLQRQLAAGLGRDDAGRDARLLPRNQPVLCSPFVLGGANTPASSAPTVAQLNAEALSALAYTQVIRKGCPAIYGHYLSTVSMKSGAPMAGTPEISLMNFMIGQMARFYGVPWRTSNTLGGAKTFDAQAGYESATTLMAVMHAGANYIWHSAGLERGGHALLDRQVRRRCRAMRHGLPHGRGHPKWDDFDEALAACPMWGRAGTISAIRTRRRISSGVLHARAVRQQRHRAMDRRRLGGDHGARAGLRRKLLADYEEPKLDEADEALRDYIARREREIPAVEALNQEY
jgi:trimethylamine--corrinoid protein Co-methyltransferase